MTTSAHAPTHARRTADFFIDMMHSYAFVGGRRWVQGHLHYVGHHLHHSSGALMTSRVYAPIYSCLGSLSNASRGTVRVAPHPHVGPLIRNQTRSYATKPSVPYVGGAAHVRNSGPTCATAGPRAQQRVHVRNSGPTCATAGPRAQQRAHVRNSEWAREPPRWSVPGPRPRESEAGGVSAAKLPTHRRCRCGR